MDYPKSVPNVGLVDGQFADENPATGQVGSLIPSAWGNAVTQELLNVIKAAGFAPAEGQTNQLLKAIQGLVSQGIKNSVRVATTGAIALSGVQTIDAIVLVAGDRVLVKNQASGAQNGIYVVAAGAWVRALDADESVEVKPGMLVGVDAGTANGGSVWRLSNATPPTLGTTALTFEQVFGKTGVVAGSYKSVTVGADGRVTGGTNPTTLAGFGITDAFTKAESNAAMQAAIAALVGSSPDALNTINELAAALGNDPNFLTTMLNLLAGKADKSQNLAGYGINSNDPLLAAKMSISKILDGTNTDLNTLGNPASDQGYYVMGAGAGALPALNYPVQDSGSLVVSRGAWGCFHEYTTRTRKFIRGLTGAFTGSGPWSDWVEVTKSQATEALSGVAKVATSQQVDAGVDDSSIVTPKKLRWGFSISATTNGYIAFPSWLGGFIFQWGTTDDIPVDTSITVPWPLAYTINCFALCSISINSNSSSSKDNVPQLVSRSANSMVLRANGVSTTTTASPQLWFSLGV